MSKRYALVLGEKIVQMLSTPFIHLECDNGVNDATHFYNSEENKLQSKQAFSPEVKVDGLTVEVSGLPEGVAVETNGAIAVSDQDVLLIEYDVPGIYTVSFSGHTRYLDMDVEVSVGND